MIKLIKYKDHDSNNYTYFFVNKEYIRVSPIFDKPHEYIDWFTSVTGKPEQYIESI